MNCITSLFRLIRCGTIDALDEPSLWPRQGVEPSLTVFVNPSATDMKLAKDMAGSDPMTAQHLSDAIDINGNRAILKRYP
jgi:hypothetical protein